MKNTKSNLIKMQIKEFEDMRLNAELNVLKKVSLEQSLNSTQFNRFRELALKKLKGEF